MLSPDETADIMAKIIASRGVKAQYTKAVEEFTELNLALLHFLDGRVDEANLLEEIIDAEIMLNQLKMIYIIRNPKEGRADLAEMMQRKLERLKTRVGAT